MPQTKEARLTRKRMNETGETYQQALVHVREQRPEDSGDGPHQVETVEVPISALGDQNRPSEPSPAQAAAAAIPPGSNGVESSGPTSPAFDLPQFDPEYEQRVRLDPLRRSMYLGDPLARAYLTTFIFPDWLTPLQKEIVTRVQQFLGNLTLGWPGATAEDRKEALLEMQGEMDDLDSLGLVLAMAGAEQVLLPPPGLPGVPPARRWTLIVSVLRKGQVARWEVIPLVIGHDGASVQP